MSTSTIPTGCHVLLERTSARAAAPEHPHEIRLFSKCRNEKLRMPAFLRHYRKLGVDRFFIVDNGSTDGSTEYLAEQPDVRVFQTHGTFREAQGGTSWLNALLSNFGVGKWCVTVDADELLCYPGCETAPLRAFTAYLDQCGSQALACMLLDMYPSGALRDCTFDPDEDLPSAAPFFDPSPYKRLPFDQCPNVLIYGGVRERVFFPESYENDLQRRLHVALYYRLLPRVGGLEHMPWLHARRPHIPPCLTKVPLVRWDEHSRYLNVNHFVSPKKLAAETGVLMHFKMLQDFHQRAEIESVRGQYFDGSYEYVRYAEMIRRDPRMTLMYPGSTRFTHSAQLVELDLIHDTKEWRLARGQRESVAGTARAASGS